MDKSSKSELYSYTDIELQVAFRIATENLASPDTEIVKSAHNEREEIKAVQQAKKLQP